MTSSYFGGANAVIIVFDLTNKKSFDAVEKWIKEAQSFSDKSKPLKFLLVGNKKDLEKERVVDKDEPKRLADKYQALYCETSAKTGAKVDEAFQMLGEVLRNDADDLGDRLSCAPCLFFLIHLANNTTDKMTILSALIGGLSLELF